MRRFRRTLTYFFVAMLGAGLGISYDRGYGLMESISQIEGHDVDQNEVDEEEVDDGFEDITNAEHFDQPRLQFFGDVKGYDGSRVTGIWSIKENGGDLRQVLEEKDLRIDKEDKDRIDVHRMSRSPSNRYLALCISIGGGLSEVRMHDLLMKTRHQVTDRGSCSKDMLWDETGQTFYFLSNKPDEYADAWVAYNYKSGALEYVDFPPEHAFGVPEHKKEKDEELFPVFRKTYTQADINHSAKLYSLSERGHTKVVSIDAPEKELLKIKHAVEPLFSSSGDKLFFVSGGWLKYASLGESNGGYEEAVRGNVSKLSLLSQGAYEVEGGLLKTLVSSSKASPGGRRLLVSETAIFYREGIYEGEHSGGVPEGYGLWQTPYEGRWSLTGPEAPTHAGLKSYLNVSDYTPLSKKIVVYYGKWREGRPEGRGIAVFENNLVYSGEWYRGVPQGAGHLYFGNGEEYDGIWREGALDGRASCQREDKVSDCYFYKGSQVTYNGEFEIKRGRLYGLGIVESGGLDYKFTYEGQVADGKWEGKGRYTREGRFPYVSAGNYAYSKLYGLGMELSACSFKKGEFKYGKLDGEGVNWNCDRFYRGELVDGMAEGYGEAVLLSVLHENGALYYAGRYKGEWEDGRMSGVGVFEDPYGNTYEGDWDTDKIERYGKFTSADGRSYVGAMSVDAYDLIPRSVKYSLGKDGDSIRHQSIAIDLEKCKQLLGKDQVLCGMYFSGDDRFIDRLMMETIESVIN